MNEAKIEILVLEAQAGRRSAMGELYNAFYDPMRKYALLRVGDAMIAEDLPRKNIGSQMNRILHGDRGTQQTQRSNRRETK